MKFLVVASSFLCLVGATLMASGEPLDHIHWELYKKSFGKVYADAGEESLRRSLFLETKRKVEHHNGKLAADLGFEMGYSHLSDWTQEELNQMLGSRTPDANLLQSKKVGTTVSHDTSNIMTTKSEELPDEVDWRKENRVGPVRDQGRCASAYAFAITGMLEGQQVKVLGNKTLVPLSIQSLIDCSKENQRCWGGSQGNALDDIVAMGGIESEQDYPYVDAETDPNMPVHHTCAFDKSKSVMHIKDSSLLLPAEEILHKYVANYGPIAVKIHATQALIHYKSGVINDPHCRYGLDDINHPALVVGYGTDTKLGDYWILKNSWGTNWGDNGYFKLARNQHGLCGISQMMHIATFS